MSKKKKLHRTIIQVEVLSNYRYDFVGLDHLVYDITDGDCSGNAKIIKSDTVEGLEAVKSVHEHKTDTDLFFMDDQGNEMED